MSQSLAKNLIHLTFSTKDRKPTLPHAAREGLHRYMAGILADLDSPALAINSVEDHAHLLLSLSKNHALADVVMELKRGSSKWLKPKRMASNSFIGKVVMARSPSANQVYHVCNPILHARRNIIA